MTLHPAVAAHLDDSAGLGLRPYEELSPADARAQNRRVMAARRGPDHRPLPMKEVVDRTARADGHEVAVRIYRPTADAVRGRSGLPTVVFFHGGGWVFGDLDSHDDVCRQIAQSLPAVVVAVDYRLSPEHPFPAPIKDAEVATRWAAANIDQLGGDPAGLVVAGDSAGGAMSTVVARRLHDADGPPLAAQLLLYPVTDLAMTTPSYTEMATGHGLTAATMAWFIEHYGGSADDPDASPMAATELAGLPPAVATVASHDPLRDEGLAYAARLTDAGVHTTLMRHDGLIHAYALLETVAPARDAFHADLTALAELLAGAPVL